MTPAELDAIEARANAASAGPWTYCGCGKCAQVSMEKGPIVMVGIGARDVSYTCGEGVDDASRLLNAEFCAHARQDVPALVAEVRRFKAERKEELDDAYQEGWDAGMAYVKENG